MASRSFGQQTPGTFASISAESPGLQDLSQRRGVTPFVLLLNFSGEKS